MAMVFLRYSPAAFFIVRSWSRLRSWVIRCAFNLRAAMQGLNLFQFSAQRKHILWDTLRA